VWNAIVLEHLFATNRRPSIISLVCHFSCGNQPRLHYMGVRRCSKISGIITDYLTEDHSSAGEIMHQLRGCRNIGLLEIKLMSILPETLDTLRNYLGNVFVEVLRFSCIHVFDHNSRKAIFDIIRANSSPYFVSVQHLEVHLVE
ncbi:hypothetical protein PENTCL1PPCAC_902, partial [Pristionchus entomophagus]